MGRRKVFDDVELFNDVELFDDVELLARSVCRSPTTLTVFLSSTFRVERTLSLITFSNRSGKITEK